jgi:hypothetical protein
MVARFRRFGIFGRYIRVSKQVRIRGNHEGSSKVQEHVAGASEYMGVAAVCMDDGSSS